MPTSLSPALTPHGVLYLTTVPDSPPLDDALSQRLSAAFARGAGAGLLQLGAAEVHSTLPPAFAYFRDLAQRHVTAVCLLPEEVGVAPAERLAPPASEVLAALAQAGPPIPGGEYLSVEVLEALWQELDSTFVAQLASSKLSREEFLKRKNPAWNLVGRVHFNLAENRKDEQTPFAFLATYTTRLSANAKAQHLPLGRALEEYVGAKHRAQLLSLLLPVQRAAEKCAWLRVLVDEGEIYHPLRWTPAEAFALLQDVPSLEAAGIVVRVPGSWRGNRPARPRISASVGAKAPTVFGQDALLDFRMEVSLDGEALTPTEIKQLLASSEGLALLRGRWVEVQPDKLSRMLDEFRALERDAADGGMELGTAMRLLAGANVVADSVDTDAAPDWSQVTAGGWLAETLRGLRSPESLARIQLGPAFRATLRPYQELGVRWLHLLVQLRLGACLADDMGLGKTIQVLALLLVLQKEGSGASLLVAPASLLANWAAELERFAPSLRALVVHPSEMTAEQLQALDATQLTGTDLVITSYGTLLRQPTLTAARWRLLVLDEAQAIKNPSAKQTRVVKKLTAQARIALTGTPVENRLGDLWSIFDFTNPGLLGTSKQFTAFTKRLAAQPHNPYGPLRELVRPYILRRLKTDKTVIGDLPDKTEQKAFCQLSRKQVALYEQAVRELADKLENSTGIQRRGLVLSMLMRMKQICNHPAQWLGDGAWHEAESGKLLRLRELAEVIAEKQEKVLVFSQFRETTAPLAAFLGGVFGRPGLVLHGDTAVKQRKDLVARFQNDETIPFFVLSLKAGGSGLNLTAASHVIHFDRWWNPAVENQATDRAFRIGQTKNVLVHKFVCRGTVEEKIDQLIESKRQLSADLLEGGAEHLLTELDDAALMKLVALDIHSALAEKLAMYYEWKPYVPVAQRRKQAQQKLAKLVKKGHPITPVSIEGRVIAKTFWGKSWCDNLEGYGDYASRLPRGRTYVRNGSVVHLQIDEGMISAWVSGSELYKVSVKIGTVTKARWSSLVVDCAGEIDSIVELLQGRLSDAVMTRMCKQSGGLFPSPSEIEFDCSCPDWAAMCKHVAAVLYGVGARLDEQPALLFALRAVNEQDLITQAGRGLGSAKPKPKNARLLAEVDLGDVFGIDLAEAKPSEAVARRSKPPAHKAGVAKKKASRKQPRSI